MAKCNKPACLTNALFFRDTMQGGYTPPGTLWILTTGFWVDANIWIDTDFWID